MAKQVLNNGDTGLQFRTKANENFTELYDSAASAVSALAGKASSSHTHEQSDIAGLVAFLATLAPLVNAALTGVPTAPTATLGTNTTQIANTAFVQAAIAALVNSSPASLNQLNELAAALGNDPNFATTVLNALAGKVATDSAATLDSLSIGSSTLGAGSAQLWDTVTNLFIGILASDGSLEISGGIDADGPVVANSLSVGGLSTFVGALRLVASAMPAFAIDVTKPVNTKTISADATFTFSSNTPTSGTRTEHRITNSDSSARTATIPSCYSFARNANITSVVVPASSTMSLAFEYTGSRWEIYGDPVATSGTVGKYVLLDDSTPPTDGQVPVWDNASSKWAPGTPSGSGGGDMLSVLTASEISVTTTATLTINRMHVCSGTSADYTVTLPAVSGNTGKFVGVRMASGLTKLVTVDGNASETIDGASSIVLWANETAILFCDGTAWTRITGKSIPLSCNLYRNNTSQSVGSSSVTKVGVNTTRFDNQGTMANLGSNQIVIRRDGLYNLRAGVQYDSLGASTNTQCRIHVNGSVVATVSVDNGNSAYPCLIASIAANLSVGDTVEVYGYQTSGGSVFMYVADPVNFVEAIEVI